MIRKCGLCKEVKELTSDNFHADKSRPHGFMFNCKPCEKIRTRNKYLKNPRTGRYASFTDEQKKKKYEIGRIYCQTHKGKAIASLKAYQKFDKDRNFEFDLTQEFLIDIRKNQVCVYCGYPPTGVDRIDNLKGHTVKNCVPCCLECNVARMNNFTHEEMFEIGKAIKTIKDKRTQFVNI